jgi:hypothetical protein
VRKILVVGFALIVSASGAFTAYALVIKDQARGILADISRLNVGASSQSEVDRLAQRHKSQLEKKECKADRCWYFFKVRNRWLSGVRIEPAARFQAWVTVGNGKVEGLHAEVQRDTGVFPTYPSAGIVEEYVKYPEYDHSGDAHYGFPTPIGKPYLLVVLDSHATSEQRRRAYTLSLTCLVKLGGGCDLPCDYLPLAWKDWEVQLQKSGWAFEEYYPSRARCN